MANRYVEVVKEYLRVFANERKQNSKRIQSKGAIHEPGLDHRHDNRHRRADILFDRSMVGTAEQNFHPFEHDDAGDSGSSGYDRYGVYDCWLKKHPIHITRHDRIFRSGCDVGGHATTTDQPKVALVHPRVLHQVGGRFASIGLW